jgi:hypothetical protein
MTLVEVHKQGGEYGKCGGERDGGLGAGIGVPELGRLGGGFSPTRVVDLQPQTESGNRIGLMPTVKKVGNENSLPQNTPLL